MNSALKLYCLYHRLVYLLTSLQEDTTATTISFDFWFLSSTNVSLGSIKIKYPFRELFKLAEQKAFIHNGAKFLLIRYYVRVKII